MRYPLSILSVASVILAVFAQTPAGASPKPSGTTSRDSTMRADRAKPTVPIEAATVRQFPGEDGNDIANRFQDRHHGEGQL